jgi:hypothetical protein
MTGSAILYDVSSAVLYGTMGMRTAGPKPRVAPRLKINLANNGPKVRKTPPNLRTAGSLTPEWRGQTDYSGIPNPSDVTKSKPTPRQVQEMKRLNRRQNEGLLRDDVTGEEMVDSAKSKRGIRPRSNEVQVDHVKPVDAGGTREQSNLLLRTRKNNRAKSNK